MIGEACTHSNVFSGLVLMREGFLREMVAVETKAFCSVVRVAVIT